MRASHFTQVRASGGSLYAGRLIGARNPWQSWQSRQAGTGSLHSGSQQDFAAEFHGVGQGEAPRRLEHVGQITKPGHNGARVLARTSRMLTAVGSWRLQLLFRSGPGWPASNRRGHPWRRVALPRRGTKVERRWLASAALLMLRSSLNLGSPCTACRWRAVAGHRRMSCTAGQPSTTRAWFWSQEPLW
jgi:hypothetical protein